LDTYRKKAELSISAIFEMKGEIKFRKMEHEAFVELLNAPGDAIIGLGEELLVMPITTNC
jgi:shikimate kinase